MEELVDRHVLCLFEPVDGVLDCMPLSAFYKKKTFNVEMTRGRTAFGFVGGQLRALGIKAHFDEEIVV